MVANEFLLGIYSSMEEKRNAMGVVIFSEKPYQPIPLLKSWPSPLPANIGVEIRYFGKKSRYLGIGKGGNFSGIHIRS